MAPGQPASDGRVPAGFAIGGPSSLISRAVRCGRDSVLGFGQSAPCGFVEEFGVCSARHVDDTWLIAGQEIGGAVTTFRRQIRRVGSQRHRVTPLQHASLEAAEPSRQISRPAPENPGNFNAAPYGEVEKPAARELLDIELVARIGINGRARRRHLPGRWSRAPSRRRGKTLRHFRI